MKLATNKWNTRIVGEKYTTTYYGYKTKKEAKAFVEEWNASHTLKIEVVKREGTKWVAVQ